MNVDLHTHSTASDGTMSPTELVAHAKERNLAAIAITDHDTTAGLAEGARAGADLGVECIPGCELSATYEQGEMHILGLWLPLEPVKLLATLRDIIEYRHNRNHIIVEKLQHNGVDITYESVQELAGEGSVGRPHIARRLMELGKVKSVQEAFDRYLGPKGSAYAPKKVLTAKDAVTLLKEEGASVVLAHPGLLPAGWTELGRLVRELKGYGLDGLEAYYSEHSPAMTAGVVRMAEELDLVVSGGSDFHGTVKPLIHLGKGKNNLSIGYEVVQAMKDRRAAQGLPV